MAPPGNKEIHIGTSGWIYDDWAERFYPKGVRGTDRLTYYAERFNTVEVNATFYRFPTPAMIGAWNERLNAEFHLVIKGSRTITHFKRLRDCAEPLKTFMERARRLRRLRVILWQLPPGLRKDAGLLDRFLTALPAGIRHAVEFRHESWWAGEVVRVLKKHRAALVAVSVPGLPGDIIPTTDFLYLRFHGMGSRSYQYDYSRKELARWVERLRPHLQERALYAFFNNDHRAMAPKNAAVFRELMDAG